MSSGDSGVGGDTCYGESGKIFEVDFASSCPYVLSVGSTEWDRFQNSTPPTPYKKLKEVATARFPSGGGFSNVFPIPFYQLGAVTGYLLEFGSKLGFKPYTQFVQNGDFSDVKSGVYHVGGRAYPDVGAVGDRQVVYSNGSWWLVGGTSLSSPIWGAVLNLVNEERLAKGKSTVGFVHPALVSSFNCRSTKRILTVDCSMPIPRHLMMLLREATLGVALPASLPPKAGIPSLDLGKHNLIL
jgi:tripeptidyl-peptidase-1